MSRDPRETPLNNVARETMMRDDYDQHYASLEQRVQCETRLFLARFDAICRMIGVDPSMLILQTTNPTIKVDHLKSVGINLPLLQWRSTHSGEIYTEILRAEAQTINRAPLIAGDRVVIYRGDDGKVWCRREQEFEDGRFEAVPPE